jgi:hypothetical protein
MSRAARIKLTRIANVNRTIRSVEQSKDLFDLRAQRLAICACVGVCHVAKTLFQRRLTTNTRLLRGVF